MKPLISIASLTLVTLLSGCASEPQRQTTLLRGLTYYAGPENLSGKFAFLYQFNEQRSGNNNKDKSACLYEFDIASERLSKLADCPDGQLVDASPDGLCVNYWLGAYSQYACTNAFIYSTKTHLHRNVTLDAVPSQTCIANGHVFFALEGVNYKSDGRYMLTNGVIGETKIVDYNIAGDTMRTVELPGASKWEYITYDHLRRAFGQTNMLSFHYNCVGKHFTEGKDYPEGEYGLNIQNGNIHQLSKTEIDEETESSKAYNGHGIMLLGEADPQHGYQLLSIEGDPPDMVTTLPEPGKHKVLHSFSKSFSRRDSYSLHGTSPDRRYTLVLKMHADESSSTDYIYSYYLVDVTNGNTRLILNDATGVKSENYIKPTLFWVDGS